MPPTAKGELKFNRDVSFLNTIRDPVSGDEFSTPIIDHNHTQWTSGDQIPAKLRDEIDIVISGIFGPEAAKNLRPNTYRLCWYIDHSRERFNSNADLCSKGFIDQG